MSLAVTFLHAKVDEAVAKVRHKFTCRGAGCSACCNTDTMTHIEEVRAIAPHVSPEAWERVKATTALPVNEMLSQPCPLLDLEKRTCSVYQHRPAICRAFNSLEDPKRCENGTDPTVKRDRRPGEAMRAAADNVMPGGHAAFDLMVLQLRNIAP